MNASVIDQTPTLSELLDIDGFREVCRTFSELYGIGIKVFDVQSNKIVDMRANTGDHCGYLFSVHATQVMCTNLVNQIKTQVLDNQSQAKTVDCFSGLRYKLLPIVYEGSVFGRLIFGPYAPEELSEPPKPLKLYEPQLDIKKLGGYLSAIPRAAEHSIDKILEHVTKVLGVIIHNSYKTHVTSRLHIASISGAFQDLDKNFRELKKANEQLQELDRLKSNFIATVSHELRTPLTSVIGYSEMLLEGMAGSLTDEQRDYVKTILEKGESLLSLIAQILDLARVESGNMKMTLQEIDPKEIARLSLTDVTPQAKKRNIVLTSEIQSLRVLRADADKIRRILTNLLGNAVKFTPENGRVTLRIDTVQAPPVGENRLDIFEPARNDYLRFQVIDTGIGIPQDKLEHVFDAFFQVDNTSTREFGGTGLGLSIARNFALAHGGRIEVQSKVGQGSTFSLLLPFVAEAPGQEVGGDAPRH